jgi:2,4-didehydro-3-deoxy-L-rhamnonate hydrolase
MRFANHAGRMALVRQQAGAPLDGAPAIDINRASHGRLPSDPAEAFSQWNEVCDWAASTTAEADLRIEVTRLSSPSPSPAQIFGIGINYADHGAEAGMERPETPLVFTKLGPAIAGPFDTIELPTAKVDWEVEVAVIIGRRCRAIDPDQAWDAVAGITGGQDLSEREIQWRPSATPQFGLGKSLPGFAPLGPVLVTADEFPDPDDIALACRLNGEEVQNSRTSQMLLSVPELVVYLSSVTTLLPGDVIFTGTPSGIGMTRTPPRYLAPGDQLESLIEGVGTMSHTFVGVRTTAGEQT